VTLEFSIISCFLCLQFQRFCSISFCFDVITRRIVKSFKWVCLGASLCCGLWRARRYRVFKLASDNLSPVLTSHKLRASIDCSLIFPKEIAYGTEDDQRKHLSQFKQQFRQQLIVEYGFWNNRNKTKHSTSAASTERTEFAVGKPSTWQTIVFSNYTSTQLRLFW